MTLTGKIGQALWSALLKDDKLRQFLIQGIACQELLQRVWILSKLRLGQDLRQEVVPKRLELLAITLFQFVFLHGHLGFSIVLCKWIDARALVKMDAFLPRFFAGPFDQFELLLLYVSEPVGIYVFLVGHQSFPQWRDKVLGD